MGGDEDQHRACGSEKPELQEQSRDQRAYEKESEKPELYAQTTRLEEAAVYLKQGTKGQ